ncbi:MAG: response regulator, partial [Proteobacteria bacterium]|nr:response regulator [Pseudomonadota bacterium]
MGKAKPLSDIRILLAESDLQLGIMLQQVLQRMGFKSVQLVRDGELAVEALQREQKDILITEWQLQALDGISVTHHVRRQGPPENRLLPIIMMTARAERQDVEVARDAGITEFVVKPYNSTTVFRRIQQVIDNPRGFLLAQQYVGPDRRRRNAVISEERRQIVPKITFQPEVLDVPDVPQLILPDYLLKQKLGDVDSLDKLITPQVLAEAQQVIDGLRDESLQWIRKDVQQLNMLYRQLLQGGDNAVREQICTVL